MATLLSVFRVEGNHEFTEMLHLCLIAFDSVSVLATSIIILMLALSISKLLLVSLTHVCVVLSIIGMRILQRSAL